jgi:hypothetical protein
MNTLPDIPDDLVAALKAKRCAAYVGAGFSISAGLPDWISLLQLLVKKAVAMKAVPPSHEADLVAMIQKGQLLMAAQELMDGFGHGIFQNELQAIIEKAQARPGVTHNLLTKLPFSFVVTTNYDQLIENAYFPVGNKIPKVFTHQDTADFADALWRQEFFILKAHGDIAKKSSIILTEKDYRSLIYSSPAYRSLLNAIFATKSVFFLGVSLSDPELLLLLRSLHDAFQGNGQYHYALVSKKSFNDAEVTHWRKHYKIQCIVYDPSDGHPEIQGFLEKLVTVV